MSSAVWARMFSGHCSLVARFWISVIFLRTAAASVGRCRERTDSQISWTVEGSVSLSMKQTDRRCQKWQRGKGGVPMPGRSRADIMPCMLSRAVSSLQTAAGVRPGFNPLEFNVFLIHISETSRKGLKQCLYSSNKNTMAKVRAVRQTSLSRRGCVSRQAFFYFTKKS